MRMARGHAELLPDSSSLGVLDWRASRTTALASGAGTAIGEAMATAVKSERMTKDLMLKVTEWQRGLDCLRSCNTGD